MNVVVGITDYWMSAIRHLDVLYATVNNLMNCRRNIFKYVKTQCLQRDFILIS